MKARHILHATAVFALACLSFCELHAQTMDELNLKIKQLEAKNSSLEAKVKSLQKGNKKNSVEAMQQMQELQDENAVLSHEIQRIRQEEQDKADAEEKSKTVKIDVKDPVFKEYLLRYCDMDGDGVLSQWDAEHTYVIDFGRDKSLLKKLNNTKDVNSLDGIEHFVNLRRLVCTGNSIPNINLSQNVQLETLIANSCELKLLDVSKNVNLKQLECCDNMLYTIDLKGCPNLKTINLYKNKMTAIDLSACSQLKNLICSDNTLTTLDVSKNVELEGLDCSNNQLVQLSLVNNGKLVDINCSSNSLTSVDLQNGCDIKYIDCSRNKNLEFVILSKGKRALSDKKDGKTKYK